MIGRFENTLRTWRRRLSRSEWMVKLLGLPVSEGTANEPGLVLIQIDGLARVQLERALKRGRMKFVRRLMERQQYELHTLYSGLPSTTPSVQGELHYGTKCAVPAFSFLNRKTGEITDMFHPEMAKLVEARLEKTGEGLLKGGSSWCNIYRGGATTEESHFCSASLGVGDIFRSLPLLNLLTFPILHFPSVLRILFHLVVEFIIAFGDMLWGILRAENVLAELRFIFSRVLVCAGLRELVAVGTKIDIARGVPIVHVNFLGYDEQAHRRGPSSKYAHWSLGAIDRVIEGIYGAAHRSARRDYQVWLFSDHGQEDTQYLEQDGKNLHEVLAGLPCFAGKAPAVVPYRRPSRAYLLRRRNEAKSSSAVKTIEKWLGTDEPPPFLLADMGPVGHLYLREPCSLVEKTKIAESLVRDAHVPGVLILGREKMLWFRLQGEEVIRETVAALPHPPELKAELADDLRCLCAHDFAGDFVLLGWSSQDGPKTFVQERGSHGGVGVNETQGFALLPARTRLAEPAKTYLRPADLRTAARHFLGRERLSRPDRQAREQQLRIMTYNVHSCLGMDGRISPYRIVRVIERYNPDIVALQEVDLGRERSHRHDQSRMIAEALGMHVVFCPTVVKGEEQYGHALLSHHPIEVVRTDILMCDKSIRCQPRGALWVRMQLGTVRLNVMNTHFGLSGRAREAQAADLLGENWIGGIPENEPLILCGDFNMGAREGPYHKLTRRLRDAQTGLEEFHPLNTFATIYPLVRIDHVFVSPHFTSEAITVPRNHLTRVASDHLPLIVDLKYQPS